MPEREDQRLMADILVADQAVTADLGRLAGFKYLLVRSLRHGGQFRPGMLVEILPRHVETLPADDFGAEEAVAEAQRLGFDIDQDDASQHEAKLERIDLFPAGVGPTGPLVVPVIVETLQQGVFQGRSPQRQGCAIWGATG